MDRNLDGVYFRIKRNGEWVPVCFSDMTEDEMREVMIDRNDEWLRRMCIILGKRIREIGDQLDLMAE